jgi:glycine betaine/proline transport system substrate-binding protein
MMVQRRSILQGMAAGAALAAPRLRAQSPLPLVIGQIALSFYEVVGALVEVVLERSGVPFQVVRGQHGEIYPRLASGEVDLLVAAWLPHAHGALHVAASERTTELAELYREHVPATSVRCVEDLKRPEVLARMERRIVGIGPDSGLMRGAARILGEYGLDAHGYSLVTGPPSAWVSNARAIVDNGRWAVIPAWQPLWMNRELKLRILEEPRNIYLPDRCVLVVAKALGERLPAPAFTALSRMQLSLAAVTDMDHAVAVAGVAPRAAALQWLESQPGLLEQWLGNRS